MVLRALEVSVLFYYSQGLASSTLRLYKSGKDRYTQFCSKHSISSLPVTEHVLSLFVSTLANQGLKHQTIKCYLSAIRHLQVSQGFPEPYQGISMPRLEYVLRGLKKNTRLLLRHHPKPRLPITPTILKKLKGVWETSPGSNSTMLWAACCLVFFGFLRAGEFTIPSEVAYDSSCHFNVTDIHFHHPTNPSLLMVTLKQSKTDQFRKGITLMLGRTGTDLCPVASMAAYVLRGKAKGPLFCFSDGHYLTRQRLVQAVQSALGHTGVEASQYTGHNFWIGAATTAAARGLEDSGSNWLATPAHWPHKKIPALPQIL